MKTNGTLNARRTPMESLRDFLITSHDMTIFSLARYIGRHIAASWEAVFEENLGQLRGIQSVMEDAAYGVYGKLLFERINEQLREARLCPKPRLPGNYSISREWGPQHERQRCSWSGITSPDGRPLGTIAVILYHDHTRLHIPRAPDVLPLSSTTREGVIAELSARSDDFAQVLVFVQRSLAALG